MKKWHTSDTLRSIKLVLEVVLLIMLVSLVVRHIAHGDYKRALDMAGNA